MPNIADPAIVPLISAIGTISAVLISLVSIVVAVAALYIQRRHNRKSVLPIIQIDIGDYEDCLFVRIENVGVGPAIIKSVEVRNSSNHEVAKSLIEFMPDLARNFYWGTFIEQIEGRAIGAQGALTILEFAGDSGEIDDCYVPGVRNRVRNTIRAHLALLTFSLTATDIYGKEIRCSRSLEWFGRLLDLNGSGPAKKVIG